MESSLLVLNDDCIREVFEYLQFPDYYNLATTCQRLRSIVQIEKRKYKNIGVLTSNANDSSTVDEISNILTAFGKHVASVYLKIYDHNCDTIMKMIVEHCTKLISVELVQKGFVWGWSYTYFVEIPFRNLKELKVGEGLNLSIDNWKKCFANNPGIETLQYDDDEEDDDENTFTPLKMLSKLKNLTIKRIVKLSDTEINYLSCLTNLTKFSFTIWDYRVKPEDSDFNRLLIKLAENLKLLELDFAIRCDADTFAILKSFLHLEVLSIRKTTFGHRVDRVPENTIFPSKLKHITLDGINIPCNVVLSIIKQLKLLEGLTIVSGKIFRDDDESDSFPNDGQRMFEGLFITSRIAEMLRVEKRKLKITFIDLRNCRDCRNSIDCSACRAYRDCRDCRDCSRACVKDDDDYGENQQVRKFSDHFEVIMNYWIIKEGHERWERYESYDYTIKVKD